MCKRARVPLLVLTLSGIAIFGVTQLTGFTNANVVPRTAAGQSLHAVTPNDFKPPACAGLDLAQILTGSGSFAVGTSNTLVLGSPGDDAITVLAGNNCIVAGPGTDTCSGSTTFTTNVYVGCETLLP